MSTSDTPRAMAIRLAFRARYLEDIESDTVRPVEHYQSAFPGFEDVVAEEHSVLARASAAWDTPLPVHADMNETAAYAASQTVGEVIAGHRIERLLAKGGQGAVYLATDPAGRRVAFKILRPLWSQSETARKRFVLEARILAAQEHPGLCTVYDAGQHGELQWISMKFVDGESLAAHLSTRRASGTKQVSAEEVRRATSWIERTARAVHRAHEIGAVHRDLKPSNVMITGRDDPVVLDFGLAHAETADESLTRTGDLLGTPAYMAPEQVAGGSGAIDRRTDVYALGALLYELVTLEKPIVEPDRSRLYAAILTVRPRPARSLNPAIPRDLDAVLDACLQKAPSDRYQTAESLAADLAAVREGRGVAVRRPSLASIVARRVRSEPALSSLIAAVVVVLGIGIVIIAMLNRRIEASNTILGAEAARASAAQRDAETNLEDFSLLQDLRNLDGLEARADELWPAIETSTARMDAWVSDATAIASRLDRDRAARDRVRSRGRETPFGGTRSPSRPSAAQARFAEIRGVRDRIESQLERTPGTDTRATTFLRGRRDEAKNAEAVFLAPFEGHGTFEFEDPADAFAYERLDALVRRVRHLAEDLLPAIETRRARAASLSHSSIDEHADAWRRTVAEVRQAPAYHGLALEPIRGLVPIGRDPESGLFEFAHLLTGIIPARDAAGKLRFAAECGVVLVLVPGGPSRIGASKPTSSESGPNLDPAAKGEEGPVAEVDLAPYFISKYELTQRQWQRMTGTNPSASPPTGRAPDEEAQRAICPVENVSADDCLLWLRRFGLDLPTEAQWEHSARAGKSTVWWTGDDVESIAGCANVADVTLQRQNPGFGFTVEAWLDDGFAQTAPVNALRPNPFGLHHVIGNVREWTKDRWGDARYACQPGDGIRLPPPSELRGVRGGSFAGPASNGRSSARSSVESSSRYMNTGVRPARALP